MAQEKIIRTHNIGIANSWAGHWSNQQRVILLCCGSGLDLQSPALVLNI